MTAETPGAPRKAGLAYDFGRALFWFCLVLGVLGAGVAIASGPTAGQAGSLLLISLAASGLVFLLWMSRGAGAQVGLFPEIGAAEAAGLAAQRSEFALLDSLDEPALVIERSGGVIAANSAYLEAANAAGQLGESSRPPAMDRLFGADPALSAPMFRLAKAAGAGQSRREELPSAPFGPDRVLRRLEASVAPLGQGRALWRLRQIGDGGHEPSAPEPKRLFMEDAPFGFYSARADGTIHYANRALRALIGVGENESLRVRDLIKDDPGRLLRRDRRGFGPQRAPVTLRARDGVETRAAALTVWPGGDLEGGASTFLFFEDGGAEAPSPVAKTESGTSAIVALAEDEAVFENAPFGMAVLDSADAAMATILDANPALMEMSQGRATPGVSLGELFDASDGPAALAQHLRAATERPIELQLAGQPGLSVHLQFARANSGRGIAYIANVSEHRELQQRLAQSEKMREIGTLAGGVAHDFNNLLTVVMQNTEFLLRRHPAGDPDYSELIQINQHALRCQELAAKLTAYARQQTFKREIIDVSGFIANSQELLRRLVGESIRFEVRHGRDLPAIKADPSQIERVLVNLAANARDAMLQTAKSGALSVRTATSTAAQARALGHTPIEDGEYVLIEVADTGVGIKPEDQAKIFRPFHSTKEAGKGTGLGLATSYGIVKQSGGYIFFESKLGVGTTFRLYLPVYTPTPDDLEEVARRERASVRRVVDVSGRGRILIVEDEYGVRQAFVRNLTECGFEVVQAENGEDALEALQAEPGSFDLILSDVSMPVMTGPELLEAAGAELIGKAKVVFLSGYAPESFSDVLERHPNVSFLSKPIGATHLAQRVKELITA